MNFKSKEYYKTKAVYFLGCVLSALAFDTIILIGVLFA
jgi:hypothetical protein